MTGQIRFCRTFDGARLAYSQAGRGPAMVEVATGSITWSTIGKARSGAPDLSSWPNITH